MAKFNEYPAKTTPKDADKFMLYSAEDAANKLIDYDKLADAVLNKLTSKTFGLDAGTMTLPAALNQLNSNAQKIGFKGNIKSVEFRSGATGLKNIYIDFYQADNSRSTLAFLTDGENAIGFYDGSTNIWKFTVK